MQRILTTVACAVASAEATQLLSNFKTPESGDLTLVKELHEQPYTDDSTSTSVTVERSPALVSYKEFTPAVSDASVITVELTDDLGNDEAELEANSLECCR